MALDWTQHPQTQNTVPGRSFVACAAESLTPEQRARVKALHGQIHETVVAMLAAHPEINLLVESTGQRDVVQWVRQVAPPHVSILDLGCASLLRGLATLSEVSEKCKRELTVNQNLLRTMMDEIPDEVFFLNVRGRILDVNTHPCRRLGLEKKDLLGRTCEDIPPGVELMHPESPEKDHPLHITLKQGQAAENLQSWVDEQGKVHYYRIATYPVKNSLGEMQQIIMVRRDVTLRTEMEKRLQQSEKLAAIGELSMYIAHEIRNPLFAIGGFANSLLRAEEISENSREKVRIILDESKRLDTILKNIINFARPTKTTLTRVNVNQVVEDTMNVLGIGCAQRGVELSMQLASDLPAVRGDAELLKQSLINVVKNALEAMSQGGKLTIATAMEHLQVMVAVQDTGQGISKDIQKNIFSPFFTTKQDKDGSGLGLAMTKKIISDLGGDVQLESSPGQGTRVKLLLQPYVFLESEPGETR